MKLKRFLYSAAALLLIAGAAFAGACGENGGDYLEHADAPNAVTKKGVCVSRYNDGKATSAAKINDLNAGWYYTWGVKPNNDYINAQFVPMIWGAADVTDDNLNYIKQNYENGKFTHLLTFNEPDLPDQSDMTVDEALSHWEKLQSVGIPLSSPVVSWYSADKGNPWLDEFMQKAAQKNYRVDFITIHIYQSFYSAGAVNELKKTLDALYNKFKLPVWLTEFGAIDVVARDTGSNKVSASCTAKNALSYAEQATNMLEQCGYVERYAWFLDNFRETGDNRPWEAPFTTLYNDDDTVSEVGKTYRNAKSNFPLILKTTALESGKSGEKYEMQLEVSGGTGNYTFTASGLPEGLKMSASGKISGKPKSAAVYPVKITVTDGGNSGRRQTRTHAYSLTVK